MKEKLTPFLVLVAFLFFTSCEQGVVIDKNLKIENSEWEREKTAKFQFEINDSLATYQMYLNFRHGGDYPYQNLYLFTRTKGPNGIFARDTAQMLLADNRGRWLGKGIGDIFDYQFKFKSGNLFPVKGTYTFEIEQAMYDKVLESVTDIGLTIKQKTE